MPSNFKALAGAAAGSEASDANFKNVTLLLHGDGSNGAQNNTFIDSSTNNFTITRNGNTTQGSFSPYGSNWSNYFDGSGDWLEVPSDTAFAYGTGDLTLECWIYKTSTSDTGILENRSSGGMIWYIESAAPYAGMMRIYDGSGFYNSNTVVPLNQWVHLVACRQNGTLRYFVNGVAAGSMSWTTNLTSPTTLKIMRSNEASQYGGYVSNLRIVKGTAVYTSNFTPPTAPLTAISGTSLLTCQSNRFRDGSTNNFTITRNGDVRVTNFAPFAPSSAYSTTTNGGSAYFASTGTDALSFTSTSAVDVSTGDFTFETWVYFNGFGSDKKYIIQIGSGYWQLVHDSSFGISLRVTFYTEIVGQGSNSGWTEGQWYHVALVRSGNNWNIYRNGVSIASATNSSSIGYYPTTYIGNYSSGNSINGYLSDTRLVKGTAVYTSNFTPPTAPLAAISGTSLLTKHTNAAIFDNSMKNDLETVGNAQISTSVKKFGTGSMYFDGTGDYLKPPANTALDVSSGDFTIEAWVYKASNGNYQSIYSNWNDSNSGGVLFCMNGLTPTLLWRPYDIATGLVTGPTISSNTWTHVAVVRSGNSFTIYTNGTGGTSATYSTNSAAVSQYFIGAYGDGSSGNFNGYLDEIRVTKAARYTSNFTAPTAPFPNK